MSRLSVVQRWLWSRRAAGFPERAQVGAVRLTGELDTDRLHRALGEVVAAMPILRAGFTTAGGEPAMVQDGPYPAVIHAGIDGSDRRCLAALRRDRDRVPDPLRDPLVRFHLFRCTPDEHVLGLVADPLVLDLRSVYLVLGALLQAYVGRLRADHYPPFGDPLATAKVAAGRRSWWSSRLTAWQDGRSPAPAATPPGTGPRTAEVRIAPARWHRLTGILERTGNPGWLAVIAMLTWWRRTRAGGGHPVVFAGTFDLRDYLGLGPVAGPLTDRLAFEVDLDGFDRLTFQELVRRVHAGVLDAVLHYLPYGEVVALGQALAAPPPPRSDRPWDLAVNYCRLPPASTYTRGEQTLARQGLSIELFRESDLAAGGTISAPVDVQLAESGTSMAMVVNFEPSIVEPKVVAGMLSDVETLVDRVTDDPAVRLGVLRI